MANTINQQHLAGIKMVNNKNAVRQEDAAAARHDIGDADVAKIEKPGNTERTLHDVTQLIASMKSDIAGLVSANNLRQKREYTNFLNFEKTNRRQYDDCRQKQQKENLAKDMLDRGTKNLSRCDTKMADSIHQNYFVEDTDVAKDEKPEGNERILHNLSQEIASMKFDIARLVSANNLRQNREYSNFVDIAPEYYPVRDRDRPSVRWADLGAERKMTTSPRIEMHQNICQPAPHRGNYKQSDSEQSDNVTGNWRVANNTFSPHSREASKNFASCSTFPFMGNLMLADYAQRFCPFNLNDPEGSLARLEYEFHVRNITDPAVKLDIASVLIGSPTWSRYIRSQQGRQSSFKDLSNFLLNNLRQTYACFREEPFVSPEDMEAQVADLRTCPMDEFIKKNVIERLQPEEREKMIEDLNLPFEKFYARAVRLVEGRENAYLTYKNSYRTREFFRNTNSNYRKNDAMKFDSQTRAKGSNSFICFWHKKFGERAWSCEGSSCIKFTGHERISGTPQPYRNTTSPSPTTSGTQPKQGQANNNAWGN